MKRTFIAVHIPPADDRLLYLLRTAREYFKVSQIRWTEASNLHITLAFLGDTEDKMINRIVTNLEQRMREQPVIDFTLTGAGFFGNPHSPRVIWAGTTQDESLYKLREVVCTSVLSTGFNFDPQPFSPHLTLGRVKRIASETNVAAFFKKFGTLELQHNEIREIIFFESILSPAGAIHRIIHQIPLTGS